MVSAIRKSDLLFRYGSLLIWIFLGAVFLITLRLAAEQEDVPPIGTNIETDVDWANPPCNPNELSNDWKDITDPRMAQNSNRRIFQYKDTHCKVAFEKGDAAMRGYAAKDHWHRYNPAAQNDRDFYLDKMGNPVGKNSSPSHILPNCK